MITRPITRLNDFPLNKSIVFQIDPHGHFLAIYLPNINQIKIIKTISLQHSYLNFILRFQHKWKYTEQIQLDADAKIPSHLLFSNHFVHQISISSLFRKKQLIGVTNFFAIKIFRIQVQQSLQKKLQITPIGEVILNSLSSLMQYSFWYQTLHVTYFNRNYESYQYRIERGKQVWTETKRKLLGTNDGNQESLRLLMYSQQLNYENKLDVNDLYEEQQIDQQRQQQIKQKQRTTRQLYANKKLIRLSNNELKADKQTFVANTFYHQSQIPKCLSIIYINRKNILCKARYNPLDRVYQSEQICKRYEQSTKFNSIDQEQFYLELRNSYPMRYIRSQHPNYIICFQQQNTKRSHSVRSKNHQWNIILKDDRFPIINQFYRALEQIVFQQILLQTNKQFIYKFFQYIKSYQILFIGFPKDFKMNFQLIVIDRSKKQNKQVGVQMRKYKMCILEMDKLNPQITKWISATEMLYLTKDLDSKRQSLHHLRIEQNVLIGKIRQVYLHLVFEKISATKLTKVVPLVQNYIKQLQKRREQRYGFVNDEQDLQQSDEYEEEKMQIQQEYVQKVIQKRNNPFAKNKQTQNKGKSNNRMNGVKQSNKNFKQGNKNIKQIDKNIKQCNKYIEQGYKYIEQGYNNMKKGIKNIQQGDKNIQKGGNKITQVDNKIKQDNKKRIQVDNNIKVVNIKKSKISKYNGNKLNMSMVSKYEQEMNGNRQVMMASTFIKDSKANKEQEETSKQEIHQEQQLIMIKQKQSKYKNKTKQKYQTTNKQTN